MVFAIKQEMCGALAAAAVLTATQIAARVSAVSSSSGKRRNQKGGQLQGTAKPRR